MRTIIQRLRKELKEHADEKTRLTGERFFKEDVRLYGIRSAVVSDIAKKYYKEIREATKQEVFSLCEELWRSGIFEEAAVACSWSYGKRREFIPEDIRIFERWVDLYVTNWAACDTLCNHTVGAIVEQFPDLVSVLKKWALSENRWMRRAAAVSLIVPARKGLFLREVFEIADILLLDKEDLVQKGYGWMLKVTSQHNQREVFQYVLRHKSIMPRTALRYAIEKMPDELRQEAMGR